ncbi:tRNA (guanine(9)-N1)-methyltransferase [Spatholobus suberectus]|nr:tRNA (guanine(9)-N1)-methyltransferase [Spatholobus suberectus]
MPEAPGGGDAGAPLQTTETEDPRTDQTAVVKADADPPVLSKNAQKKLAKQQRYEAKKAEKKAAAKEQRRREVERKRKEWEESLASVPEGEREKLLEARRNLRKERMEKRTQKKESKRERLSLAREQGQNVVVDLQFSHLMNPNEIHSLVQQIMYCYAVNGRCASPAHLWLTGCDGEMESALKRIPGFDKWIVEKENRSYVEALRDRKEDLVYLTADSEIVLEELDLKKVYVIGGLVDRNRWKGITLKKAQEQGIQTAKLPIGNFMKMSSSQVLTVNQVVEILLKFLETRDWNTSFFAVIPLRKRYQSDSERNAEDTIEEEHEQNDYLTASKRNVLRKPLLTVRIVSHSKYSYRPVDLLLAIAWMYNWKTNTSRQKFQVGASHAVLIMT